MKIRKNEIQESQIKKQKSNKILQFVMRHKVYVLLIVIIVTIFIWAKLKIYVIENKFTSQKEQLIENYEIKLDSLNVSNIELTTKVFSWAIRSELIRENLDQVNQFFISFIQEPNIVNIKLVNPKDSMVVLSTNKKEEGHKIENVDFLKIDNSTVVKDSDLIKVINPIMGLNKKLGILIVEVKPYKEIKNP